MICPHCGIGTSPKFIDTNLGRGKSLPFTASAGNCSECDGLIVFGRWTVGDASPDPMLLYPTAHPPRPVPPEVTGEYRDDFVEACAVFDISPKASAALSRRLLQHVLREKAAIKKRDLNDEIQEAIDQGHLPSDLAEDLDAIRTIGNFAAHPLKSTNTGEVVNVEAGEAEFLLNVLEELLDYYFVRPARRAEKRTAINAKLSDASKPELKTAPGSPPAAVPPVA
jgi:hypothetical protein